MKVRAVALLSLVLLGCHTPLRPSEPPARVAVLISASLEWKAVRQHFAAAPVSEGPFGEWLLATVHGEPVVFVHGGYGKVAAAGSTQWALEQFHPELLVNLGTCGGFDGLVKEGEVLLVNETIIYDITELMGDPNEALADYHTKLPHLWPEALRAKVREEKMLTADRDLDPAALASLQARFHGVAADWESGAIAWVAARNHAPVVILRVVTDLVHAQGDVTYGDLPAFEVAAAKEMERLLSLFDEAVPLLVQALPAAP
jgi:adenosylhomocysteine nucleosidase